MSENPRPASTPPNIASEDKDEREEDKIAAELEVNSNIASCVMLIFILGGLLFKDTGKKKTAIFFYYYYVMSTACHRFTHTHAHRQTRSP